MSTSSAFSIRSREVASRFLQSAVIVDDQARLGREDSVQTVVSPGRGPRTKDGSKTQSAKSGPGAATHDLDAKRLIDAFAELGVVCAVLKPDLGSAGAAANEHADSIASLSKRTDEATKRADIVILDWNIPNEEQPGQNAKDLIRRIFKTDEPEPRSDDHSRRLRLIVIYTGDSNLKAITGELADFLPSLLPELPEIVDRGTYRVTAGPVTIAVYGKGRPTIVEADAQRRVDEAELPERLRDEFSEMTEGLLSNVALEALSAIRINTHRILTRFNREVDAPYVAHRAMLQPPEEAEEHTVPLIASEIEGVLADDKGIPELVGLQALTEWLDHIVLGDEAVQVRLAMTAAAFKEALLALLKQGLEHASREPMHPDWAALLTRLKSYDREAASTITQILSPSEKGATIDMEFARLTSLRSQYDAPPPVLRLGSIVAQEESGKTLYLLCIQPVCDSVRIKSPRGFPFLKLKERPVGDENAFDFVIADKSEYKRLYVSRKAYDIRVIEMRPADESKCVEANRVSGDWLFQRKESSQHLRWLADLKPDFAHRVMNQFASEIARVGLTESEWLRRMATKTRPLGE